MAVTVLALAMVGAGAGAQVLFQDDFETGLGAWAVFPGCTPMTWSCDQNADPIGGTCSAKATSSLNKMYHNLGTETSGNFRGTWWIYDDGLTRSYAELRAYVTGGAEQANVNLEQLLAAGKFNSVTGPGEVYNPSKYQCRIGNGTAGQPVGWFNLDGPGSPNRSIGWHKFSVTGFSNGTVKFFVDDILCRTFTGAKARTMDSVAIGFGLGSEANNSWFDGVVVESITQNILSLNAQGRDVPTNTLYVRFGQPVMLHMDISNLAQKVNGCQAMLGYSNHYLFADAGCVAPGGGPWDELIYNSWDVGSGVPGEIDTAIGVYAQGTTGTDIDSTVASILLTARDQEGETYVVFRPDGADVKTTMLSDMNSNPVYPFKIDSQRIVIDNTPPSCAVTSATQNSVELLHSLGGTANAVQGTVAIVVNAGDSLSGFPLAPTCQVRIGGQNVPTYFVRQEPAGFYNYVTTISETTPNGVATITATATDRAGNVTTATGTFSINKNQITGQVESQGFVGSERAVTFVASGGEAKTWTPTLTFTGGVASYVLTDVPEGTTALSAKTAWSLRRKLPVTLNGHGQASASFTGTAKLLGGDINGSNSVNIQDYALLKINWFTSNALADIDGSGEVNIGDYSTMKSNWFCVGSGE